MKILLINPSAQNAIHWYPKEKERGLSIADFGKFPPMGLLYIAAYMQKYAPEYELRLLDCNSEEITYNSLENSVRQIKPDIIALASYSVGLVDVFKTLEAARRAAPAAHIVLGGHHAMAFPMEAISIAEVDSIIIGDGEIAFYELAKTLEAKKPLAQIKGVYTKESPAFLSGDKNSLSMQTVENLDELPFPSRKFLSHVPFHSILGVSKKLTSIITSRGCPYKCSYCDIPYKQYRARSISNVVDEIEQCLKEGYGEFHIYDDTFNMTSERVIEFSRQIIRRNIKIIWDFRGRVNGITEECLLEAKKAGLRFISFGVECSTDEALESLNKNITVKQIKEVFALCNKLKIKTTANFILGTPVDKTFADIKRTVDFAINLKPTNAQFSVLMLYPNTPVYESAFKKGLVKPERWQSFCKNPAEDFYVDHWNEFFTIDQLIKYNKYAYRRFYLRPSYIVNALRGLSGLTEFFIKIKALFKLMIKG